uniref:Solute carrier family 25 member 40 n=1 Tax=Sphenodon punctatus TaxID=8508 RepID=A0A8D0H105_SPHPU
MAIPATVIYFTSYEQLSEALISKLGDGSHLPVLAGSLARLGTVTIISPIELMRTKLQARQLSYRQLYKCLNSEVARKGWISLWKGWSPTILRDVPFSALYWCNYEYLKKRLCRKYDMREPTFLITFTSGAVSGSVAAAITLPFDVVKTHKQTNVWEYELSNISEKMPASVWRIMKKVVAENGFAGLFVGFIPRLTKVAPACAIMIGTYEYVKSSFRRLNKERHMKSQ